MRILKLIILLAAITVPVAAVAQQPTPPQTPAAEKLAPKSTDELAKAKSDIAWEKIKNLQTQFGVIQNNYQTQVKELQAKYGEQQKVLEAYKDQVCKDNGWDPKTVNYDAESGTWSKIPPPPAPKAEEKKPAEKK